MAGDVVVAGWGHPYVVHVQTFDYRTTAQPLSATLRVRFRHANNQDTRAMITRHEHDLLQGYVRGMDHLDIIDYSAATSTPPLHGPSMRCDIFGSLYMDFSADPAELSELLIYLAALFILSDVVRYQVDQWARLLDDHPDEAIFIERFLDVAARKIPNLALNELENDYFRFAVTA